MADIKQAVKWMQEGKRVRRSVWPSGESIQFEDGGFGFIDSSHGLQVDLCAESLLADDWQLADEPRTVAKVSYPTTLEEP